LFYELPSSKIREEKLLGMKKIVFKELYKRAQLNKLSKMLGEPSDSEDMF
jgi:hypothetical protein